MTALQHHDFDIAPIERTNIKPYSDKYLPKIKQMADIAADFKVEARWMAEDAANYVCQIRELYNKLDALRKDLTESARSFTTHVNTSFKGLLTPLLEAEDIISEKIENWIQEETELADCLPFEPQGDLERFSSSSSTCYTRNTKKFEVESLSDVPREFLMIDEEKVKIAMKAGIDTIPGLKIYQEKQTIIRSR